MSALVVIRIGAGEPIDKVKFEGLFPFLREETRQDCAAVILYTAEKATQLALQAIQALGGYGYTNDANAGRLLRDAKLYEIGAGTSEIRRHAHWPRTI